jgi:hypothetical protein
MRSQYCDKNNHNTADCREITKFKQQKKTSLEAKAGTRNKALAFLFLFEEINVLKNQLKSGKTLNSMKRKTESILSTEVNEII